MRLVVALMAILAVGAPTPANAAPGHVTLSCGTYNSTGWVGVYRESPPGKLSMVGKWCMTEHSHGDHVDVTYWGRDTKCDGVDLVVQRDVSWVSDGYVTVTSPSGCGTTSHSNKQYGIGTELRFVRGRGCSVGAGSFCTYGERIYW